MRFSLENSTVMTRIIPARFEFLYGNVEEKSILKFFSSEWNNCLFEGRECFKKLMVDVNSTYVLMSIHFFNRLREFGVDDGYRMVQEILHNLELFLLSKQTKASHVERFGQIFSWSNGNYSHVLDARGGAAVHSSGTVASRVTCCWVAPNPMMFLKTFLSCNLELMRFNLKSNGLSKSLCCNSCCSCLGS